MKRFCYIILFFITAINIYAANDNDCNCGLKELKLELEALDTLKSIKHSCQDAKIVIEVDWLEWEFTKKEVKFRCKKNYSAKDRYTNVEFIVSDSTCKIIKILNVVQKGNANFAAEIENELAKQKKIYEDTIKTLKIDNQIYKTRLNKLTTDSAKNAQKINSLEKENKKINTVKQQTEKNYNDITTKNNELNNELDSIKMMLAQTRLYLKYNKDKVDAERSSYNKLSDNSKFKKKEVLNLLNLYGKYNEDVKKEVNNIITFLNKYDSYNIKNDDVANKLKDTYSNNIKNLDYYKIYYNKSYSIKYLDTVIKSVLDICNQSKLTISDKERLIEILNKL